jgi:rhomboid protease GluP
VSDEREPEDGLFGRITPAGRGQAPPSVEEGASRVSTLPEEPQGGAVRIHLPEREPIVTYALIGITVLVFLAQLGSKFLLDADFPAYFGMKINEFIDAGEYWRFLTPVFLHGNLLHIGVNMYSLYVLGPGLERHYGHWQFLLLYFAGGITGVVASYVFSDSNSLGASTAIFGLLGAFGAFLYLNREIFSGARGALNQVLRVAAINLLIGLSPGIDNWGHMGGLLGGVIVGLLGGPIYAVVAGDDASIHLENRRDVVSLALAGFGTTIVFVFISLFIL